MCSVARGEMLGPLNAQRVQVLEEGLLELGRVLVDGHTRRRSVADDLVVHVGNVHHVVDVHSF